MQTIIIPFGASISQKFNPKLLIVVGGTWGVALLVVASYMKTAVWFGVLWALGWGPCVSLTYLVPVHHGWLWFPERPGLISGIIIGGFGFGALIFDNVALKLINPDNRVAKDGKFPDTVNERVPGSLRILAYCFAGLTVVAAILSFPGPQRKKPAQVKTDQEKSVFEFET